LSEQGSASYFPGPAGSGKLRLTQPAVEPSLNPTAAMLAGIVSANGHQTLYAGTAAAPHPVFVGTSLVAPSWDRNGDVWTVQRTGPQAGVYMSHAAAATTRVGIVGADPAAIQAIRIAPDGVRVALIVQDSSTGRSSVELGLVVRSRGSVSISGLHRFETRLVQAQSVAWATDTQLAILGGDAQSTLQTYLIAIDGSAVTVLGGVPGISSIAATAQHPTLAGTSAGVIWADSGSGWRKVLVATWPGYPG
jgi:Lipoprotein LpqB beta-propeller domain